MLFNTQFEKCHFFSFYKIKTRRVEQVLSGDLVPMGGGRRWGKAVGG
jgi:hypothetical protein